jgi:hypothetical protein
VTPHTKHTRRIPHVVPALLVLVVCAFGALSVTGNATAAKGTPCGKKVLADWWDNGRIDRLYPLHCYEDAIDAIPEDIREYSDAQEIISRALQGALRDELVPGGNDPTPGGDGAGGSGAGSGSGSGGGDGEQTATPDVDTSGPSSVPIPLLVLGGMSLALLAAGAIGYVSRRRQAAHVDGDGDDPTLD